MKIIKKLRFVQVQLYIGNLSPEWQEDTAFATAMSQYGALERAYVMRNAKGLSKVAAASPIKPYCSLPVTLKRHQMQTGGLSLLPAGIWLCGVLPTVRCHGLQEGHG